MSKKTHSGERPARLLGPAALLVASAALLVPHMADAQSTYRAGTSRQSNGDIYGTDSNSRTDPGLGADSGAALGDRSRNTFDSGREDDLSAGNPYGTTAATATPGSPLSATGLRGGSMLQGTPLPQADSLDADDLNTLIDAEQNPAEGPLDPGEAPVTRTDDGLGLRLGSFRLRPSVNESINTETTRSGGGKSTRTYLSTTGNWDLRSDWSRHALTVVGEGTFERNISGRGATDPQARIDGTLRLDLADDTIANLTAGYAYQREDANDPNAIADALDQADVNRFTGGAALVRDLGLIRGTAGIAVTRTTYGSVRLSDGRSLSLADRDRTAIEGRLRLGYEISPAIIPFVEATIGQADYDSSVDFAGYARSSNSYAGRAGIELDLGEKLRGELALGYAAVDYEDRRLTTIDAFTADGALAWSPQRGTVLDLGLRTTVQDSTAPGASGWVDYQLTSSLSHVILQDLTGRLTGSATLRDFPTSQNELNWQLGAGLIWTINRYFDVTANLGYEHTDSASGADSNLVRAGVGLTLRR